jgi:DNA/RNA-binding domain of Phe-tRNA-synthetase-like protein
MEEHMALIVSDEFRSIFPDARIGIVLAKGINNREYTQPDAAKPIAELLDTACRASSQYTEADPLSANPAIALWREAFQRFKTKKGARSSIEALLGRVKKANPPRPINPLVDIYNAVSLTYGLPCGGEDLDTIAGTMRLTVASGGEPFIAIGESEDDAALPGEVIYADDKGAVCRCWNWRDGQRTMLTENTKNAILVIESLDPARDTDLNAALALLAGNIKTYLGGETSVQIMAAR